MLVLLGVCCYDTPDKSVNVAERQTLESGAAGPGPESRIRAGQIPHNATLRHHTMAPEEVETAEAELCIGVALRCSQSPHARSLHL
jgi:hypothetical protein